MGVELLDGPAAIGARRGGIARLLAGRGQEELVEGIGLTSAGGEAAHQYGDGIGLATDAVETDAQRI